MPLFALICHDSPGYLETRKENREAHLSYISESEVVQQAGPLLDQQGEMCGSLLILDVPDRDAALHWAASDPYALAGLFESVTLREWKKVIG